MVAQSVEQRTFNPLVVGSSPTHPTTKLLINNNFISEFLSKLLVHTKYTPVVSRASWAYAFFKRSES